MVKYVEQYERGTYDAMQWLAHYQFKTNFPFFIQSGYNMKIIKRITETCSDEMISIMNKHIHTYSRLTDALSITIGDIQVHLMRLRNDKEDFMKRKLKEEQVKLEELEDLLREKPQYTPEQEEVRKARYRGPVPLNIILKQKVLDSGRDCNYKKTRLTWTIYDMAYSNYFVVIDSPVRGKSCAYGQHVKLHNIDFAKPNYVEFDKIPNYFLSPREWSSDIVKDSCIYGLAYKLLEKAYEDDRIYLAKKQDEENQRQQNNLPNFPEVQKIEEMTEEYKRDRKNPFQDSGDIF